MPNGEPGLFGEALADSVGFVFLNEEAGGPRGNARRRIDAEADVVTYDHMASDSLVRTSMSLDTGTRGLRRWRPSTGCKAAAG